MPGFGTVDYSLIWPRTTVSELMEQQERLGAISDHRSAVQQQMRIAAEEHQMRRAEYERDLNQIRQVKQAVIENTLDDGNLDEPAFLRSLYKVDPKLALTFQNAVDQRRKAEREEAQRQQKVEADELARQQHEQEFDAALSLVGAHRQFGLESPLYRLLSTVKENQSVYNHVLQNYADVLKREATKANEPPKKTLTSPSTTQRQK